MLSEKMRKAIEMVRGGAAVSAAAKKHGVNNAALGGACDALGVARPRGRGGRRRSVVRSALNGQSRRALVRVDKWRFVRITRNDDGTITLTEATKGEYDAEK